MSINLKKLVRAVQSSDEILTAPVNEYLLVHHDDPYPDWVVDRIASLLRTVPRVRVGTFSASSAGQCPRAQVLAALGAAGDAIDPQLANIFSDGKWRHMRWQAMLLTIGALLEIEYGLRWQPHWAVGTMDGLGVVPDTHPRKEWRGEEFGFELKGVSTFLFANLKDKGPMEKHLDQVHRYFLMSGLRLFVIVYEDKTTQEWKEWVIEADPKRLEAQKKELECLSESASRRQLPPMLPDCAKQKGETFAQCPYGKSGRTCVQARDWPTDRTPGFERSGLAKVFLPSPT